MPPAARRIPVRHTLLAALLMSITLLASAPLVAWAPPAAAGERWQAPVAGRLVVVRGFDPPAVRWGSGHRGVDLAASTGDPVLAAGDGVVGYAGLLAGRGVVTVVHGPLRTTYEPVTASVHPGAQVARGSVIGHLAPTGLHCGPGAPCLHWGLLRGDTYLDPLLLLGLGQVRLYPLEMVGSADGTVTRPGSDGGARPSTADPVGGRVGLSLPGVRWLPGVREAVVAPQFGGPAVDPWAAPGSSQPDGGPTAAAAPADVGIRASIADRLVSVGATGTGMSWRPTTAVRRFHPSHGHLRTGNGYDGSDEDRARVWLLTLVGFAALIGTPVLWSWWQERRRERRDAR